MKTLLSLGILILGMAFSTAVGYAASPAASERPESEILPYTYGKVISEALLVYDNPGDPSPSQWITPVGTWVSIRDQHLVGDTLWYRIDRGGWVPATTVELAQPSTFQGIRVVPGTPVPFGFVIANLLNVRAAPGVSDDNPPIGQLERYGIVPILEETQMASGPWYRIGDNQWVSGRYVARVAPVARPAQIPATDRWIAVDLKEQILMAYEGDQMVYATLVSTGLPKWPTVKGVFRIWVKIKAGKMSGGSLEEGDYYYLADVPWTMYFEGGYGLHAAYWHDEFGTPQSHGCVNLSPADAYWLFHWATPDLASEQRALLATPENPGTWVYVYE